MNFNIFKYDSFINWYPVVHENGKIDKIPCRIREDGTCEKISAVDPANFMPAEYAVAWAEYGKQKTGVQYGIGLSLTDNDPYVCLDFDNVYDPKTGIWHDLAIDAVARFQGAFFETSVSGRGMHMIATAALSNKYATRCNGFPGEFYSDNRFIALTGLNAHGNPNYDITAVLTPYLQHFGWSARNSAYTVCQDTNQAVSEYTGPEDDATLLEAMKRSHGSANTLMGAKCHVWDLWKANPERLGQSYPAQYERADGLPYDRSQACAALIGHLAYWTGKNPDRMTRLFRMSGLYDPEKHDRAGGYHITRMVRNAISGCTKVYDKPVSNLHTSAYLTTSEQIDYFDGCTYVVELDRILTPKHGLLRCSQFNVIYGGKEFQMETGGARPTRKAWEAFTENRNYSFPKVRDIYFNPNDEPGLIKNNCVNTWVLPEIDMREGDPRPFLNLVRKILPHGDDADILITWMQAVARYPGRKTRWSPVIQGTYGNGKSTIGDILKGAIGDQYFHVLRPEHLGKEQNGWLQHKRLIFIEEIRISEKREALEVLKPVVSNDYIEIRDMGVKGTTRINYANLIFFTNYKDAIPVNNDERRYCIMYTAQQSKEDKIRDGLTGDYFTNLKNWLKNGGQEIVNNFLINSPITNEKYNPIENCSEAPKTTSTEVAIYESLSNFQRDILEASETTVDERVKYPNGSTVGNIYTGVKGFRNGWLDTAYLETVCGYVPKGSRYMAMEIEALGYKKATKVKASKRTYGDKQGRLYYKGSRDLSGLSDPEITELCILDQKLQ